MGEGGSRHKIKYQNLITFILTDQSSDVPNPVLLSCSQAVPPIKLHAKDTHTQTHTSNFKHPIKHMCDVRAVSPDRLATRPATWTRIHKTTLQDTNPQ